jgi:tRNA U38,U39,U40 pseudouridine synthase TruA
MSSGALAYYSLILVCCLLFIIKFMRYFLHLAYDGTNYHGWQVQPEVITVQQEVNRCLSQVLRQPISTLGSGRTDTGVHASHQVAHFSADIPETLDLATLLYRLNRALPADIAVQALHPVPDNANARFDANARTYEYYVRLVPNPFRVNHSIYLDRAPDWLARFHQLLESKGRRNALRLRVLRSRVASYAWRNRVSYPGQSLCTWHGTAGRWYPAECGTR